jgi:transposase
VLHFLPPYCPDDNRIERLWKDLHDNVTRNHKVSAQQNGGGSSGLRGD